ncbi:MAG: hypothetical protein M0R17_06005 [Candidatus Omnitrophica bacterium]|jgi:hypothetical protein|nr:hypothetical protein [Candidatus Omnitrophota bacterium]
MDYTDILKLVPMMQSTSLLSENYSSMKKKKKNLLKQGVDNILGVSMIKATAESF